MTRLKLLFALFAMILVHAPVLATTVTVSQAGGGDFTSIWTAILGTSTGDTIKVTDSGTYSDFLFVTNRTILSDPMGAEITSTVVVTGNTTSTTSFEGFTFRDAPNAIDFYGDGPDFSSTIGTLNITDCTFSNITDHGILLNYANNGNLNVHGSTFTNCGQNGITLWRNCSVVVADCTFSLNGLGGSGNAGIFIDGDNNNPLSRVISLSNDTFSNNLNGIKSWRRVKLDAVNTTITANFLEGISVDGQGGGSTVTLTNSDISGNNDRGITLLRGMTANLSGCSVAGNGAEGFFMEDFGGGDDFGFPPSISIDHCRITGNAGRGVTHQAKANISSVVAVTDSVFIGNPDRLFSCQAGTGRIRTTIERNTFQTSNANCVPMLAWNSDSQSRIDANLVDGGLVGVSISQGMVDVYNNTIVNSGAGGLVLSSDTGNYPINIHNNIIAQSGSGIRAAGDGSGFQNASVDYNLVNVAVGGVAIDAAFNVGSHNNIVDPPSFVNGSTVAGSGDYRLGAGSAARNAGDPAFVPASDLDGNTYQASHPDLGSYTGVSAVMNWMNY